MKKLLLPLGILLVVLIGGGYVAFQQFAKMRAPVKKDDNSHVVARGDLVVSVVETGNVDSIKSVEVKSRVSGRLKQLLVEEGQTVTEGQLIAVIDPKETQLVVEQNSAQLRGTLSAVERSKLEIAQRRLTVASSYRQAQNRVAQLEMELRTQPVLTQAAITSAQSTLNTSLQEKQRLMESSHPTQRVAAQATLDEAKANLDNAQRELDRAKGLEAKGFTSGRAVDTAKLSVDLAMSRMRSAQSSFERLDAQLRSELSKIDEQIRQARSELVRANANRIQDDLKKKELESAREDLARAKVALGDPDVLEAGLKQTEASADQIRSVLSDSQRQLGETEIRAPMSGVVTKKLLEVGELATGLSGFSQGTPIVRIEDRTSMRVKLSINEIDVAKMTEGMVATVDVDAIPGKIFTGKVIKIAPASEDSGNANAAAAASADAVVKYKVEILLEGNDPALRTGMSAKCTMEVTRRNNAIILPVEFAVKEGSKYFVESPLPADAKPDTKPTRTEITIGAASGALYEVLSGLKEGDKVARPNYTGPKRQGFMSGPGGGGDDEAAEKDKDKAKQSEAQPAEEKSTESSK